MKPEITSADLDRIDRISVAVMNAAEHVRAADEILRAVYLETQEYRGECYTAGKSPDCDSPLNNLIAQIEHIPRLSEILLHLCETVPAKDIPVFLHKNS